MRKLTRRSILGGAAALPFIAAPALANIRQDRTFDRTAWDRAKAAYFAAVAASDHHWNNVEKPSTHATLSDEQREQIREESDRLYFAVGRAERPMMEAPAPDMEAVLEKLARLWEPGRPRIEYFEPFIRADLGRIGRAVADG